MTTLRTKGEVRAFAWGQVTHDIHPALDRPQLHSVARAQYDDLGERRVFIKGYEIAANFEARKGRAA